MNGSVVTIVAIIIGVLILCVGIFYLVREKDDRESRKVYGITAAVGAAIAAVAIIKIIVAGL